MKVTERSRQNALVTVRDWCDHAKSWYAASVTALKVHKIEIFFGFDFEICIISLLVMSKYSDFTIKIF